MKKLAALAVAGLVSVTASAVNWVQIDNDDIAATYIDTDSITSPGGYKQLFIKGDFYSDQITADGRFNQIIFLDQIDCKSTPERHRTVSTLLRKDGQHVFSSNTIGHWAIIYPDSIGSTVVERVCP